MRGVAALRRYKWLALLIVIAGTGLGVAITRMAAPQYEVHSTVWISQDGNRSREHLGPIRADEVLHQTSWPELLTSFAILEKAVRKMSLYVQPARAADSALFAGFDTEQRFRTGAYQLKVVEPGSYRLLDRDANQLEAGVLGDSVGRKLGLRWKPSAAALRQAGVLKFTLVNPREAAMGVRNAITTSFPAESNLLRVTLVGSDPQRITAIMNSVLQEFIAAAADLKKRSVSEAGKALALQLAAAGKQLEEAETALEKFRVETITLPTEAAAGVGGGAPSRDPMSGNFFAQKVEVDNIRRDRVALESTLAAIQQGQLDPSALWAAPAVQNSPAPELRAAIAEFAAKQAALRAAQRMYTDDHKIVRDLNAEVAELKTQTIPRLAAAVIAEQRRRELALDSQVQNTAQQLRGIPTRTTEETRLRREVEGRGALYSALKNKHEEATLAEASTVADVSILDAPAAPESPSQNRAPYIILMSVLASIGVAIAVALLLDQFDRRFRYAEQATNEMGLDIIGAIPALQQAVPELRDPLEAAHAREAFRTIRLAVMQSFEATRRGIVTISSPGAGDGKSLLSMNLALSFADANCRTLLVDGDIRRGELHARFGVERLPGFVDYLAGGLTLDQVLRETHHERLTLLPRGASQLHGPEMLLSPAMSALLTELEEIYDVVIIDSPPLGAGIDPFVLGTHTGNMLLVLRSGETDRRMAQAKLKVLNRLPIRLLGAVLNATGSEGDFSYYSYLYSDLPEEAKRPRERPLAVQVPVDPDAAPLPTS
ncbi:MAG TPA: polysaccharide biosynthesis tyrosine autokinase [Gemmatimonadaceae bacterium]